MWRKGNPSALLVGMQTGAATVGNSMEFPQKTKNGFYYYQLAVIDEARSCKYRVVLTTL